MPRRALKGAGGVVIHVLNRSARRSQLFFRAEDYRAFEKLLAVALRKFRVRLLAYCIMPNHWHLVVWPQSDELPRFMHWLTTMHARQWHEARGSKGQGCVYQDRYKAIPVQGGFHLLTLIRYVERNPLRANLVDRAEDWQWSSLWRERNYCDDLPLTAWPIPRPDDWIEIVNEMPPDGDIEAVQRAIREDRPFGETAWSETTARTIGLSLRGPGRPRLIEPG